MTKPDSVQPLMTSPRAMGASLGRQKETMTLDQKHSRMQPWISMDFLISRCLYVAVEMLLQTMFVLRNDPTPHQESTEFSSFSQVLFFFDPISLQSKKLWVKNLKTLASSCHFSMQHSPVYPRVSIPSRNNRGRLHNS